MAVSFGNNVYALTKWEETCLENVHVSISGCQHTHLPHNEL